MAGMSLRGRVGAGGTALRPDPYDQQYTTQTKFGPGGNAWTELSPIVRGPDERRPQHDVDPQGMARSFNYDTGTWDSIGMVPSQAASLSALTGAARGGTAARGSADTGGRNEDLIGKIDQLWNQGPVTVPPPPTYAAPPSPRQSEQLTAEERAALTSSKERSGLRLQAGLRDLRGRAAEGGWLGSGRESSAMSALIAAALGQEAETERGLLGSRTKRVRDLEDMDYAGQTHAANQNFGAQREHVDNQMRAQLETRGQLERLLAAYGMAY